MCPACMSCAEPDLPCQGEMGWWMGTLFPAPRRYCPWEGEGPAAGRAAVPCPEPHAGLQGTVAMCVSGCGCYLLLQRKPRPRDGHLECRGAPRGAREPSPPGARLLAARPGPGWNGIPGVPGGVRGIRILPALSLSSAGGLVTWLCVRAESSLTPSPHHPHSARPALPGHKAYSDLPPAAWPGLGWPSVCHGQEGHGPGRQAQPRPLHAIPLPRTEPAVAPPRLLATEGPEERCGPTGWP